MCHPLYKLALHDREGFGHRHLPAELRAQRRHARVADATRHDPVERREVAVAVEREAVHRHAASDAYADRGHLSVRAALVGR
jgi:hypothetical protein